MLRTKTLLVTALATAMLAQGAAARSIDQTVAVAEHGKVRVSNVAGTVKIRGGSGTSVHVTGTADEKVKDVDVTTRNGDVEVEVVLEKEIHGNGGTADLVLDVPAGVRLDVETVSATIDVDGMKAKPHLQSVSGDVTLRGDAESASVETVSGGIDVDGSIHDVESQSVSGRMKLRNVSGSIEAQTTSGSIDIQATDVDRAKCTSVSGKIRYSGAAKKDADLSFENFSGSVNLEMPVDLDADVSVKTFSGRILSDFGGDVDRPKYGPGESWAKTFGNGSARIAVSTFSGRVSISKPGATPGGDDEDDDKGKEKRSHKGK